MTIQPLPQPPGSDTRRKLSLLFWIPLHLPAIWKAVRRADAVHAPVPSDIGTLGALIAVIQRKRLFVRHCGIWDSPTTAFGRLLQWLLEGIAGGRNVVLATGGADHAPSSRNREIDWIFATTLSEKELRELPRARPWQRGGTLRLICACRLSAAKNVQAAIGAVARIVQLYPDVRLDILGDGESRGKLDELVSRLSLQAVVALRGNVSHAELLRAMAAANLFVFPTKNEGFPKAILEALACGLPIVASRASVIPSLIRDCGYLLDAADAESVAEAVLRMMKDEAMLSDFGDRAHERASRYTLEVWQAQVKRHLTHAWGTNLRELN